LEIASRIILQAYPDICENRGAHNYFVLSSPHLFRGGRYKRYTVIMKDLSEGVRGRQDKEKKTGRIRSEAPVTLFID